MERGDAKLLLAGAAGAAGLLLSAGSATIALISIARPPVSIYLSPAINAFEATRMYWLVPAPLICLLMSLWVLAQVVARRPLLTFGKAAARPLPNAMVFIVSAIAACSLALLSLYYCFRSMSLGTGSITDNSAFSGMSISIGILSQMIGITGHRIFLGWWQVAQDNQSSSNGHTKPLTA